MHIRIEGSEPFEAELSEIQSLLEQSGVARISAKVTITNKGFLRAYCDREGPGDLYWLVDSLRKQGGHIELFLTTSVGAALLGAVVSDSYTRIVNWLKSLAERKNELKGIEPSPPLTVKLYGPDGKLLFEVEKKPDNQIISISGDPLHKK